jgi:hypothetical protein
MSDDWTRLNDVQEAFNQITTFAFLLEQLQDAVDDQEMDKIVDLTHALNAFYPVFADNWDTAFSKAWDHFIWDISTTPEAPCGDFGQKL